MKKLALIISVLFLIIGLPYAISEPNEYEQIIYEAEENDIKAWNQAHYIANEIMQDYGITILIQEECDEVGIKAPFYFAHETVINSLLDRAMGYDRLPEYLGYLQQTLSVYPKDMFVPFSNNGKGLRILLVNAIGEEGSPYYPGGVTTYEDGWYNVYIGMARFDIITIQHELWHAFEYRIKAEFPDAFSNWSKFNPEGFNYLNDSYDITNKPKVDPSMILPDTNAWFAREYAVANEEEDRATIYETMFYEKSSSIEYWKLHPHLYEKLEELKTQLFQIFSQFELLTEL